MCFIPVTMGAKYEIRIEDLQPDFALQFTCFYCRHESIMSAAYFKAKYPTYVRIVDLQPKFRCGQCQNQISNGWQVVRKVQQEAPKLSAMR